MSLRIFLALACALAPVSVAAPNLSLLQKPAMNKTHIVFTYAGDLWTVSREGGVAARLTSGNGVELSVAFSPDGNTLAFTGQYDGNLDVYTVAATGGVPKRVTYHPEGDQVVGWTPDGKRILFRSGRDSYSRYVKLFTVSPEGGLPEALPLPMAAAGAYSPDGKRMVYAPLDSGQFPTGFDNFVSWKRYRGGRASYLWVVDLSTLAVTKIPRTDSNDTCPMWIGNNIYFLSDRDGGTMTLFRYDPASRQISKLLNNTGKDIVYASAGPGGIVYEQFGQLHIYDLATNKEHQVPIEITADLTEVRPRFQNVSREIRNVRISATGARAVFEAHGEILTAPAEKGDVRNLSRTPGVMDRSPAWSPDGRSVAWFSDESGEYALHIGPQNGAAEPQKVPLAGNAAFYFDPRWSPDSKRIAFTDNQTNLWEVEVASSKLTKVDSDYIYELNRNFYWSPDSKWLAFQKSLPNRFHAIFLYSLENRQTTQVTDGMSDALNPVFDRDGQYLYFTASTNYGPTTSGLDMSSNEHDVTSNIYLAVLPDNIQSPLAPESDEEKPADPSAAPAAPANGGGRGGNAAPAAPAAPKPVRIDLDKLRQRIVALPLPTRPYLALEAGKAGLLYVLEGGGANQGGFTLSKYDLKTRKLEKLGDNLSAFDISANGEKMLIRTGGLGGGRGGQAPAGPAAGPQYAIVSATQPVKPNEGVLRLAGSGGAG